MENKTISKIIHWATKAGHENPAHKHCFTSAVASLRPSKSLKRKSCRPASTINIQKTTWEKISSNDQ